MPETYDWSARSNAFTRLHQRANKQDAVWIVGYQTTEHGIVAIDSFQDAMTTLEIVHNGRLYRRVYDRGFGRRGLAIVAGRFAREVARG